jgi:N-hydroxyarylamine O-acetyltransferase
LLARGLLKLQPGEIAPRNHLCLLAQVDGVRWLLDAGSGALNIAPVPLADGATTASGHRLRRVGEIGSLSGEWLVEYISSMFAGSSNAEGGSMRQYCFDLSEVAPDDIEQANHWTSTRLGTLFTSRYIVSISLKEGFASLADRVLTLRSRDGKDTRVLEDAAAYGQCLRDIFKLNVSDAEVANLSLFSSD